MKVETTKVTKLTISEIERLDPVSVLLEDTGPHQGKITIECFGQAWSSYWGGMGDRTISQFFCSCDNGYLASKLSPRTNSEILDEDGLKDHAKKHILKLRKEGDISKEKARELYDDTWILSSINGNEKLLFEIYGSEWWYGLPEKPNPDYQYLCRIIDAVKEALKEAPEKNASLVH